MELVDYLRRQFAYDDWANREVFAAIKASDKPSDSPLQLLAHILSAETLWLERLRQQPQTLPVWPDLGLGRCESQLAELSRLWGEFFSQLTPEALAQDVTYKNSKGEPWSNTVQDILTHVLLHSAYHRGQIARQMRSDGASPAYTDFIHAVRKGFVK